MHETFLNKNKKQAIFFTNLPTYTFFFLGGGGGGGPLQETNKKLSRPNLKEICLIYN